MSDSHDHGDHSHHVTSLPLLFATFGALVFLTILTVAQAKLIPKELIGNWEIYLTLAIATAKALLVALIFMQLIWDKPINVITIVGSFIFVALFLGFSLMDSGQYADDVQDFRMTEPISDL